MIGYGIAQRVAEVEWPESVVAEIPAEHDSLVTHEAG